MPKDDKHLGTKGGKVLPKGNGFYIYLLPRAVERAGGVEALAEELLEMGVDWVAPRVVGWFNPDSNNEPLLPAFRVACDKRGIQFGGWGYHVLANATHYPLGAMEAAAAIEAVQTYDLDFYVFNGEKELKVGLVPWSGWSPRNGEVLREQAERWIEVFRADLPDLPLGLTSYRYPNYHREFIWDALTGPEFDFMQPQVYWQADYRDAAGEIQLEATVKQYRDWGIDQTIIPLAPSYEVGSWVPTPVQMAGFIEKAAEMSLGAIGVYTYEHASEPFLALLSDAWRKSEPVEPEPEPEGVPEDALERLWAFAVEMGWDV